MQTGSVGSIDKDGKGDFDEQKYQKGNKTEERGVECCTQNYEECFNCGGVLEEKDAETDEEEPGR